MCACIFGDWYFWATLMLLLAFLEAMAATLVTSGGIPLSESKSDPLRWFFLCSVVCFKHCQWNTIQLDPSARAQWKIELGFRATGWCPNDVAVLCFWGQPAAETPAGISNMILDCMITGPVFEDQWLDSGLLNLADSSFSLYYIDSWHVRSYNIYQSGN